MATDGSVAKIVAGRPGVVTEIAVTDGQHIKAGERLVTVRIEHPDESGRSAVSENLAAIEQQRVMTVRQAGMARLRAVGDRARLEVTVAGLRQQRIDFDQQMAIQNDLVRSSQDLLDRFSRLVAKGFVSRVEVERRRQAVLTGRQQLGQLQQQRNGLAVQEGQARADLLRAYADEGSALATTAISAAALLQQRTEARGGRAYTIEAPIAGLVTAVQTGRGRTVESGVPLMIVVPAGAKLHAEVFAPSRAIGFVKPGQEVRLLYDAFPYQRFGSFRGRVRRVSRIAIDPRELSAAIKLEESAYRIEIEPDAQSVVAFGDRLALQPGMTLRANLVLDRRSFCDWLLQPLNAVLNRDR